MRTGSGGLSGALIWKIGVLFSTMILFPGCVEFDGQTLTYRYDREKDRLLCFQVYENIHGGSSTSSLEGASNEKESQDKFPLVDFEERGQLRSVMKGQRTFFFSNWLTEYDRMDYVEEREKVKKDLVTAESIKRQVLENKLAMIDKILDYVKVINGGFYLNDRQQLCGYQYVTISKASEIVAGINKFVAICYRSEDFHKFDEFDEADRIKLKEVIERGEWVQMEGNQFHIRWVSKEVNGEKRTDYDSVSFPIGEDCRIKYETPLFELIIGQISETITELVSPPSSKVKDDLIEFVAHTYAIKKLVPIDRLRNEFLRTGKIPK